MSQISHLIDKTLDMGKCIARISVGGPGASEVA